MAKLRAFLSEERDIPHSYTIRDIRHRYVLWKSNGALHNLSPTDMSSLIRLLGTLSIPPSTTPLGLFHTHPRASHMPPSVPHWRFLATVFRDKRYSLRYPLLPSDRYWMMRAHLAGFFERVQSDPCEAEGSLLKAGKLYATLSAHSHPDIHVPYLQALLASSSAESAQVLTESFVSLLSRRRCHPAVVDILFHAILRSRFWSAGSPRQDILHALAKGIEARANGRPWIGDSNASPRTSVENTSVPSIRRPSIGRLAMSLSGAAFSSGLASGRSAGDSRIFDWAKTVATRVFTTSPVSQETVDLRWNCLVLLALALTRSTDAVGKNAVKSRDSKQQAAVVEWQTICILAALDNVLQPCKESGAAPFDDDVLRGLVQVVRNLWRDWTTVPPSVAPPRSLFVTRLICASFFKIAGQLKDKALVDACREYTVVAELWTMDLTKPNTEDGLQEMAAEQLYTSLICGTFFERALVDLVVYASHVRTIRGAIDEAILRYARTDPEHAQELIAWSSNRNVAPTPVVVATVGVALARRGIGDFLDRYLNDARLPPELRAKVLLAHIRTYVRHGRHFMDPRQVADAIGRAFALISQLDSPIRLSTGLQSALLVLIHHQYSKSAVRLVEDATAQHPSLFTSTFYTRLLRTLLQHRQYALARRALTHAMQRYPNMASRWTSLVLFRLHREGAHRLASRLASRARIEQTPSFAMIGALSRSLHSRRRPDLLAASTLTSAISSADDPHAWIYTVNALARAGRMRAAKRLVYAVRERATPAIRTSLCNAILHGYLLHTGSSNRQRLLSVVTTYGEFADEYGFAPDHVTVNILLKAQLRLHTEVDDAGVRRLFDALVRRGYPTGQPGGDVSIPPFGTSASANGMPRILVGGLEVPRIDAPLSFKRHVEPMYKMFVKAFYLRHDVAAARKVIGILKMLDAQDRN
ncbi:hypothetical protein LXA43DRAFT_1089124 [Ganoderma leucocontextum]|nr:hypothetical protein LXA43DRAFT_1089124 [Ganoderma leucocontextum]